MTRIVPNRALCMAHVLLLSAGAASVALAAAPASKPGYRINLQTGSQQSSFAQLWAMGYLDTGNKSIDDAGQPTPVSTDSPLPALVAPQMVTPANPDISTVSAAGSAVQAFAPGHVTKGGWLANPATPATNLCISITGAAGTAQVGGTTCIAPGQPFTIPAMAGGVSVNASDAPHPFSGAGYQ